MGVSRPGPDVRVHAVQDRRHRGTARPWVTRWTIGERQHSKSHQTKAAADDLRSRLLIAVNDGLRFDPATGYPEAWATSTLTVWVWAQQWIAAEWPTWSPRTRKAAAEGAARAVVELVAKRAPTPPAGTTTAVLSALGRRGELPQDVARWLARWSLPLHEVTRDRCRQLDEACGIRVGGGRLGTATAARHRKNARAMLRAAVDADHIAHDPWPVTSRTRRTRKALRTTSVVDTRALPTREQARTAIAAVRSHQPASLAYELICWLVYLAGLRPSEAVNVYVEDLTFNGAGMPGELHVRMASTGAGPDWTDDDETEGDPKTGERRVPLVPELADKLADYIGERTSGPLFRTRHGNLPTYSNLTRAWHRGRRAAGINNRLYALRHLHASTALAAGASIVEVAERLGHSPETLMSIYAHALPNDRAAVTALLAEVL